MLDVYPDPARIRLGLFGLPLGARLMEAHSGLSARIADRAGFKGLWASGFSISTSKGRRDCSEISVTDLADVVAEMSAVSALPILADADTGFGDFNNCRITARHLQRAGACGMVIEDKVFPKRNSFVDRGHDLLDIDEFQGRIRAVKDALGESFKLIARTEGFIAGLPTAAVVERADAYADAGADGVFVHSRRSTSAEITDFVTAWERNLPLIVAPTTYPQTPFSAFEAMEVSLVLCANQNMRAAARAMMAVCRDLQSAQSLADIDPALCSVADVFELLDYGELESSKRLYQPDGGTG